jgi:hypothetical protein
MPKPVHYPDEIEPLVQFIVSDWEGQNPRLEAAALADFV